MTLSIRSFSAVITVAAAALLLSNAASAQTPLAFQGFEVNIGDWTPSFTTIRTPSGGGTLHLTAASGGYYAEVHNIDDDYIAGYYGDSGYSLFGFASQPAFPGNFSQSIKMYVFANWPTALYNGPGIWIDETPGSPAGNYGAEHNFRLTPTGSSVGVYVDGQASPIANITVSGWYNFQMTFMKGANPTDLVTTNMNVFNPSGVLIGTTTVVANSPGGPLLSQDLQGPGYVWLTVWPDGWANDVVAIDDVRADLLGSPTQDPPFQTRYAANLNLGESYIDIANTGANGAALLGPGFGAQSGNICVDVYAFDAGEELISCCSCLITPDETVNLGVNRDLTVKTLTGVVPTSVTVKLLSTLAGTGGSGTTCTNSAATASTATLVPGVAAWGTTLHSTPTAGVVATTETPFQPATLSTAELASLSGRCASILGNGSSFGICSSCRAGALGASKNSQ
jgi:hypothetical protein